MTQAASDKATLRAIRGCVYVSVPCPWTDQGGRIGQWAVQDGFAPREPGGRLLAGPRGTPARRPGPQPEREAPRAGTLPDLADVTTPATAPQVKSAATYSREEVRAPWRVRTLYHWGVCAPFVLCSERRVGCQSPRSSRPRSWSAVPQPRHPGRYFDVRPSARVRK